MNPLTTEIKDCLAYIFDRYADMEPVITGTFGIYLDGYDIGRCPYDVDIRFMGRDDMTGKERIGVRVDVERKFSVCLDVISSKAEADDIIKETEIDGKTYRYFAVETIFKYKKRLADKGLGGGKHTEDIEWFERQISAKQ